MLQVLFCNIRILPDCSPKKSRPELSFVVSINTVGKPMVEVGGRFTILSNSTRKRPTVIRSVANPDDAKSATIAKMAAKVQCHDRGRTRERGGRRRSIWFRDDSLLRRNECMPISAGC
jgi:hypothetical protein